LIFLTEKQVNKTKKGAKTMDCKIKNIQDFEAYKKNHNNFLIIKVIENPTKIHKVTCSFVVGIFFCESLDKNEEFYLNELNYNSYNKEDIKCQVCMTNK
jgi:hypothetical protein